MYQKIRLIAIVVVITQMMMSCVVYQTITSDIPLISEKNELRIDTGVTLVQSANTSITYGLTDKIAIQGYGSISFKDVYYWQASLGLYKNKGDNRIMELYSGYGYGYANAEYEPSPGNLYGNYQLYFAQFNYGKISSESSNTELGFGMKVGYLHSELIDDNYYNRIPNTYITGEYTDNCLLFEPVGMVRFGMLNRKFNIKLGGTLLYKFTNTDKKYPYTYFNLGISYNFRVK